MTAIHKKRSRQEPGNYTLISLTSVVCKTTERFVTGRLITLENEQQGYRNKRSCLTSLLDFFAQVIDTYDTNNNKAADIVSLDFQKTFDKVPHERLMLKVNANGIQGDEARWIRNWLAGRRQRVFINQSYSKRAPVTSDAPQGSVFGPLLFLIYKNDLDSNIISKMSKFADDIKLYHRARNHDDKMERQEDINILVEWANKWQMSFNIDKCSVMHIGRNNMQSNYNMSNQQLPTTDQQLDLGIIITKGLKWLKQTEKSCKTANRVLGFIVRNFSYKTKN